VTGTSSRAKEERELAIIQAYLPTQMSDADLRAIVERVVAETGASGPARHGKVMPKVLAQTKDRADGKKVAGSPRDAKEKALVGCARQTPSRFLVRGSETDRGLTESTTRHTNSASYRDVRGEIVSRTRVCASG